MSRFGGDAAMTSIARPLGRTEVAKTSQKSLKRQRREPDAEEMAPEQLRQRTTIEPHAPEEADRLHAGILAMRPSLDSPMLQDLEAIVINLKRRPDRMAACAARLQAYCSWLRFTPFSACDGRETVMSESEVVTSWHTGKNVVYQRQRAIRKGWDDLESYQVRQLVLSPGERGCAVSHIRAWEHCLKRAGETDRPLLVLEDDAAPTLEFTATLERAIAATPSDAHVLYLGYSQAADWRREVSQDVVEAEYVWTTVGYIVWPAAARIFLQKLPVDQPVDNWMATLSADGDIKAYCVRPKIIRQAEAWNVNSDVAHSDEHYWGPCSDIHHSDCFYWGNPTPAPMTNAETSAVADCGFLAAGSCLWDIDSEDSDESPA